MPLRPLLPKSCMRPPGATHPLKTGAGPTCTIASSTDVAVALVDVGIVWCGEGVFEHIGDLY